jgi:hypothetical protein
MSNTHKTKIRATTRTQVTTRALNTTQRVLYSNGALVDITKNRMCRIGVLVLRECLVSSSMCLGVPFIAPRQLGAAESILGRQFLPSVAWRTGQSGADFFPSLAKPTVGVSEPLAHQTLSGAPPDTVRCTQTRRVLAAQLSLFQIGLFLFLALRHNTLVSKTMY